MSIVLEASIISVGNGGGRSYSKTDWDSKREIITKLYKQGISQEELLRVLASQHGFRPTTSMLKKKITQWQIDRKNKEKDILAALRITLERKKQGKKTSFKIRQHVVDQDEIYRYLRRKGIRDPAQFAASNCEADANAVVPFTPPHSPQPRNTNLARETNFGRNVSTIWQHRDIQTFFSADSPTKAVAKSLQRREVDVVTRHIGRNLGGLNDLTSTERLLILNDSHHDLLNTLSRHSKPLTGSFDVLGPRPTSPELKTFTNGMWRGRDFLLGHKVRDAMTCFEEAFEVVQVLLAQQDSKFMIELYEMILNFQLDEERDILWNLLDHIDKMAFSNNKLANLSWRIGKIGQRLRCMPVQERIENAECLLRNILARQDLNDPQDVQESQSILKTLARSIYRRKPMVEAIVHLTNLLETVSLDTEVESYENCGLFVELAQLHRFLGQPDEAIHYLKFAWQKAFLMTEIYGCTDVRIRCLRTISLIEFKRGNYHLSAQHAQESVNLAKTYLGAGESLTSLVEAELKEIASKMTSLSLALPSTPINIELAFAIPV